MVPLTAFLSKNKGDIHDVSLTQNRLGNVPPPFIFFFCPKILFFDTITVKCFDLMKQNWKNFCKIIISLMHRIGKKSGLLKKSKNYILEKPLKMNLETLIFAENQKKIYIFTLFSFFFQPSLAPNPLILSVHFFQWAGLEKLVYEHWTCILTLYLLSSTSTTGWVEDLFLFIIMSDLRMSTSGTTKNFFYL